MVNYIRPRVVGYCVAKQVTFSKMGRYHTLKTQEPNITGLYAR